MDNEKIKTEEIIEFAIDDDEEVLEEKEEKYFSLQPVFVWLSIIVLVAGLVLIGFRTYEVFTSEEVSFDYLTNKVIDNNQIVESEAGLYKIDNTYLFKGDVQNNYVSYCGLLWRIIQINPDATIKMVLDTPMNQLPYDAEQIDFSYSELYVYLNDEFISYLNKEDLVSTNYYSDVVDDITNMSFENKESAYVALPTILDFLNTRISNESFLYNYDYIYWLANHSQDGVYYGKSENLSTTNCEELLAIRPVITLNSNYKITKGDGSKENPYKKEEDKIQLNDVITIQNDNWVVYDIDDNTIRLVKENVLDEQNRFGEKGSVYNIESGIGQYLNEEYLQSLSYQDLCMEVDWYNGDYDGTIASLTSSSVTCKVGMLNLKNFQLTCQTDYYLLTTSEKYAFVYGYQVELFKPVLDYDILPTIAIDKNTNLVKVSDNHYKVGE